MFLDALLPSKLDYYSVNTFGDTNRGAQNLRAEWVKAVCLDLFCTFCRKVYI